MEAVREYLAMGGYAAFVWPSYGVTALVMAAILVLTLRRLRQRQRALKTLENTLGTGGRRRRGSGTDEEAA